MTSEKAENDGQLAICAERKHPASLFKVWTHFGFFASKGKAELDMWKVIDKVSGKRVEVHVMMECIHLKDPVCVFCR